MQDNRTLLLIDGFNLLSRGYFATAYGKTEDQLYKSSNGVYTNALRVFFQKMFSLVRTNEVTHLAVAWDVKREESSRRQKYDFYKATRGELPAPLIMQYEVLREVLDKAGVKQLSVPSYEADDVIGTISTLWSMNEFGHCYIYSNDRDLFQLLNERTTQIIAGRAGETHYTIDQFRLDYGIDSAQWVDVKALLGDSSDNIPGCPGIGEKTALPLIQHYESLEGLYEQLEELDSKFNRCRKKLHAGRESAFISKELAQIICDIEEFTAWTHEELMYMPDHDRLEEELSKLDLNIRTR
ncbi:5'-3' exonuclease [Bacillus sp. FJAT-27916]|uniref:5'-3' exonuclease n=1 Tax=Bacillaceae TaxID=186817 RepID=UPI0006709643|nr:5'-3' exonuclease H3TH domain-containing protein [Bacillus sp. FJAT-27916]KMY44224.1 5'-3' exonuclease [Bacillus sp. FJAT-27916]